MKRFQYGEISASQLRADFSDDVFEHRTKGQVMRYIIMFATGHRKQGMAILEEFIAGIEERKKRRKGINSKTCKQLKDAVDLK